MAESLPPPTLNYSPNFPHLQNTSEEGTSRPKPSPFMTHNHLYSVCSKQKTRNNSLNQCGEGTTCAGLAWMEPPDQGLCPQGSPHLEGEGVSLTANPRYSSLICQRAMGSQ